MPCRTVSANTNSKFLAGGTNIIDLMKEDVERPDELVDITRLNLTQIKTIDDGANKGGVSIGGLGEKYRHGKSSAGSAELSAFDAGDFGGRVGADSQYGDERRQFESANALFLFLRYGDAVQQTRTEFRLRRARRNQPNARDFRLVGKNASP